MTFVRKLSTLSILLPLAAFASMASAASSEADVNAQVAHKFNPVVGAVFTMTNGTEGNDILMYGRDAQGGLRFLDVFATLGKGTGSGLGNQNALVMSDDHKWLFAVDAGSNEISVFRVKKKGLVLVEKVSSGGERPVSLTVNHDLLYVLNAGSDSITGFTISDNGKLAPLADSTRALSGVGTAPAQIQFNPAGDVLVVTEKATNQIDTFQVNEEGVPGNAIVNASAGQTPFGFAFGLHGELIVSEAAGAATDASSVSSYSIKDDGSLEVNSAAVPTTETAACWVVTSRNGRYAFTTNTRSSSISAFRVSNHGNLTLRDADGVSATTGEGSAPIDMALTRNGRFLYTLSAANGTIASHQVRAKGTLEALPATAGLPTGTNGLAAY